MIDVMLSTNRWVATSVSLAAMSRPTEIRCEPSAEKTVSSTQSLCEPMNRTCSPVLASMARTRVVGAAEGDLGAVGRPARAVDRVERDRDRERELPLGDVPDLDLAHPAGQAAGDGQLLAVGRERERLDPLGQADQPADQLGAVGLPEQDLVEPGDGQQRAVGREVERRDHRRPGVDGRVLHVVARPRRSAACRRSAPWAIHCVISSISAAASGGLSCGISALPSWGVICSIRWLSAGLPGTIAALVRLAPLEQPVERRHHVAAAGLGRLVAALAVGLEDRPDLLVVADLRHRQRPSAYLWGLLHEPRRLPPRSPGPRKHRPGGLLWVDSVESSWVCSSAKGCMPRWCLMIDASNGPGREEASREPRAWPVSVASRVRTRCSIGGGWVECSGQGLDKILAAPEVVIAQPDTTGTAAS